MSGKGESNEASIQLNFTTSHFPLTSGFQVSNTNATTVKQEAKKHVCAKVSQIKHTPPPKWCILAVVSRRCGAGFRRPGELKVHLKKHGDQKEFKPIKCQLCDMSFTKMDTLQRHMSRQHRNTDFEVYTYCSLCQNKYRRKVDLMKHMEEDHKITRAKKRCRHSTANTCSTNKQRKKQTKKQQERKVDYVESSDLDATASLLLSTNSVEEYNMLTSAAGVSVTAADLLPGADMLIFQDGGEKSVGGVGDGGGMLSNQPEFRKGNIDSGLVGIGCGGASNINALRCSSIITTKGNSPSVKNATTSPLEHNSKSIMKYLMQISPHKDKIGGKICINQAVANASVTSSSVNVVGGCLMASGFSQGNVSVKAVQIGNEGPLLGQKLQTPSLSSSSLSLTPEKKVVQIASVPVSPSKTGSGMCDIGGGSNHTMPKGITVTPFHVNKSSGGASASNMLSFEQGLFSVSETKRYSLNFGLSPDPQLPENFMAESPENSLEGRVSPVKPASGGTLRGSNLAMDDRLSPLKNIGLNRYFIDNNNSSGFVDDPRVSPFKHGHFHTVQNSFVLTSPPNMRERSPSKVLVERSSFNLGSNIGVDFIDKARISCSPKSSSKCNIQNRISNDIINKDRFCDGEDNIVDRNIDVITIDSDSNMSIPSTTGSHNTDYNVNDDKTDDGNEVENASCGNSNQLNDDDADSDIEIINNPSVEKEASENEKVVYQKTNTVFEIEQNDSENSQGFDVGNLRDESVKNPDNPHSDSERKLQKRKLNFANCTKEEDNHLTLVEKNCGTETEAETDEGISIVTYQAVSPLKIAKKNSNEESSITHEDDSSVVAVDNNTRTSNVISKTPSPPPLLVTGYSFRKKLELSPANDDDDVSTCCSVSGSVKGSVKEGGGCEQGLLLQNENPIEANDDTDIQVIETKSADKLKTSPKKVSPRKRRNNPNNKPKISPRKEVNDRISEKILQDKKVNNSLRTPPKITLFPVNSSNHSDNLVSLRSNFNDEAVMSGNIPSNNIFTNNSSSGSNSTSDTVKIWVNCSDNSVSNDIGSISSTPIASVSSILTASTTTAVQCSNTSNVNINGNIMVKEVTLMNSGPRLFGQISTTMKKETAGGGNISQKKQQQQHGSRAAILNQSVLGINSVNQMLVLAPPTSKPNSGIQNRINVNSVPSTIKFQSTVANTHSTLSFTAGSNFIPSIAPSITANLYPYRQSSYPTEEDQKPQVVNLAQPTIQDIIKRQPKIAPRITSTYVNLVPCPVIVHQAVNHKHLIHSSNQVGNLSASPAATKMISDKTRKVTSLVEHQIENSASVNNQKQQNVDPQQSKWEEVYQEMKSELRKYGLEQPRAYELLRAKREKLSLDDIFEEKISKLLDKVGLNTFQGIPISQYFSGNDSLPKRSTVKDKMIGKDYKKSQEEEQERNYEEKCCDPVQRAKNQEQVKARVASFLAMLEGNKKRKKLEENESVKTETESQQSDDTPVTAAEDISSKTDNTGSMTQQNSSGMGDNTGTVFDGVFKVPTKCAPSIYGTRPVRVTFRTNITSNPQFAGMITSNSDALAGGLSHQNLNLPIAKKVINIQPISPSITSSVTNNSINYRTALSSVKSEAIDLPISNKVLVPLGQEADSGVITSYNTKMKLKDGYIQIEDYSKLTERHAFVPCSANANTYPIQNDSIIKHELPTTENVVHLGSPTSSQKLTSDCSNLLNIITTTMKNDTEISHHNRIDNKMSISPNSNINGGIVLQYINSKGDRIEVSSPNNCSLSPCSKETSNLLSPHSDSQSSLPDIDFLTSLSHGNNITFRGSGLLISPTKLINGNSYGSLCDHILDHNSISPIKDISPSKDGSILTIQDIHPAELQALMASPIKSLDMDNNSNLSTASQNELLETLQNFLKDVPKLVNSPSPVKKDCSNSPIRKDWNRLSNDSDILCSTNSTVTFSNTIFKNSYSSSSCINTEGISPPKIMDSSLNLSYLFTSSGGVSNKSSSSNTSQSTTSSYFTPTAVKSKIKICAVPESKLQISPTRTNSPPRSHIKVNTTNKFFRNFSNKNVSVCISQPCRRPLTTPSPPNSSGSNFDYTKIISKKSGDGLCSSTLYNEDDSNTSCSTINDDYEIHSDKTEDEDDKMMVMDDGDTEVYVPTKPFVVNAPEIHDENTMDRIVSVVDDLKALGSAS